MVNFASDYTEGAHPKVLERLLETNFQQTPGYGEDIYCEEARALIRDLCAAPEAEVQFLTGGTQANQTVIAAALRPYQGAVAADSGHIAVHETGAIEATGHKVLTLPGEDGKLTPQAITALCRAHWGDDSREHAVQPGIVYLSQATEWGTVYTLPELEAVAEVCREFGLFLYVDGARLGYAMASIGNAPGYGDLARLCDCFTIGGTKVGALFGEAIVIPNPILARDFRYHIKQRGGMLAKGRLLGLQFLALLEEGLYGEMSRHAVLLAQGLRRCLEENGYAFLYESPSNQLFPILPDAHLAALEEKYVFNLVEHRGDGTTAVRMCTSWATDPQDVQALMEDIRAL
jgi:threonine aldolase